MYGFIFCEVVVIFGYVIHLSIGVITAAVIQVTTADQLIMCMIGSVLPDIDTRHSLLGRFNPLAWFGLTTHRGFTHTIAGCIVLSLPGIALHAYWAMFAGCISHILADWVYSLGRWRIKLM